jgi:hypothetical protein
MTPELREMLHRWLESGTDREKEAARARLAIEDPPEIEPAEYPPFWSQIGSVVTAAAGFMFDGFRWVDDEEADRRAAICHACEWFDSDRERCTRCGCFTNLKTYIRSSSCPIAKW